MERMCIIVTAGMYKRNDKNMLLDRMHKKQIKGNAHRLNKYIKDGINTLQNFHNKRGKLTIHKT